MLVRPESISRPPAWQPDAQTTEPPVRYLSYTLYLINKTRTKKKLTQGQYYHFAIKILGIITWANFKSRFFFTIFFLFVDHHRQRIQQIFNPYSYLSDSFWKMIGSFRRYYLNGTSWPTNGCNIKLWRYCSGTSVPMTPRKWSFVLSSSFIPSFDWSTIIQYNLSLITIVIALFLFIYSE